MSRFIISCGGTGGHLAPGISLAEGLAGRGHTALLLISEKRVDARLIEKYPQLQYVPVPGSGLSWRPLPLLRCLISQARGLLACLRLVRQHRPDAVIAFGGFTSAGLILAGWVSGVPVALHESNRVPGLAIRLLGRIADRLYLPPGVRPTGGNVLAVRHVGMPVRREICRHARAEAKEALGLDPYQKTLVVFGGSQGAGPLNEWVRRELASLTAAGIQVYGVMGLGKGAAGTQEYRSQGGVPVRAVFVDFCDEVAQLLSAADLVISRAGAGTIAELIRCETPAILVPYPQAADDHQRANAAYFERQGGGLAIGQNRLATLRAEVDDVIFNDGLLEKFRANLRRMDQASPLECMLDDLEKLSAAAPGQDPSARSSIA